MVIRCRQGPGEAGWMSCHPGEKPEHGQGKENGLEAEYHNQTDRVFGYT